MGAATEYYFIPVPSPFSVFRNFDTQSEEEEDLIKFLAGQFIDCLDSIFASAISESPYQETLAECMQHVLTYSFHASNTLRLKANNQNSHLTQLPVSVKHPTVMLIVLAA